METDGEKRIVIIGAGGIGTIVSEFLSRYLNFSDNDDKKEIMIVDGKNYKSKNMERQLIDVDALGTNKAVYSVSKLKEKYKNIEYSAFPYFLDNQNIKNIINENDYVFYCVDNHKSRQLIDKYCRKLDNITLISGGNELTDGNVQIYIKKGGDEKTVNIGKYHPEIRQAKDKSPSEMSCEELAMEGEPQLFFMNALVAIIMCTAFYNIINNTFKYSNSEIYIDMIEMGAIPRERY